jgi:hypothetical protein
MKVIAFTLCTMSVFLMIATVSSSDWVNSYGWREGLFAQCIDKGTPLPLPFGIKPEEGCFDIRGSAYLRAVGALMIIGVMTDFFGTLLTGLGLRSTDPNKKYKYYRVAIYALILASLCLILVVIIYPVSFTKDLAKDGNNPKLNGYEVTGDDATADDNDLDFDDDGVIDAEDDDDDNDGIPDAQDDDDDNDGIPDDQDDDDDNDGVPDSQDKDVESDGDLDDDGVPDAEDDDDDGDGIPDALDNDDDGDGIPDELDEGEGEGDDEAELAPLDTDEDGIPDERDPDIDGDGILNVKDEDIDNDGIANADDAYAGQDRVFHWGFGYGCSWACLIFLFISIVLLICDRESEEIFYKERAVEEEEGEEEEA